MKESILIKNGKIITMGEEDYENGSVLIIDGKIQEVGKDISYEEGINVIDAAGMWVIPGIVEAHCHIGILEEDKGFEGMDLNEATNPITPEVRAIDGVNPMDTAFYDALTGGVTTVMTGPGSANVIGGQFIAMKTSGVCVDDMKILEPAAMKIAFGENPKRFYKSKDKMPTTRIGSAALLREALYNAKQYKEKKEIAMKKGEYFEKNFKMECFIPVFDKKIPLKAHCHRADDILTAIRIAKEFDVNLTLDHCTEGHLISDYIKASGKAAIVGPTLTSRSKIEVKNKTFKTPKVLNDKGIKIAIMTDHPVIPIQYLRVCAGLASAEGLDVKAALKSITINAAEICGIDNRVGSIQKGKDGDIAIFNGNPLESLSKVVYTIVDGNIVYMDK